MSEEYQQSDEFALKCLRFDTVTEIINKTGELNRLLEDARRLGVKAVGEPIQLLDAVAINDLAAKIGVTVRNESAASEN